MKIRIELQSFIDVITNSSTEVFVMATEKTEQTIIEVCESVLQISSSPLKFEDVFELKYACKLDDEVTDDWVDILLTPEDYKNLDKSSLVEGYNVIIEVTVKDPKYSKFGESLSRIINTYKIDYCYG